MMSKFSNFLWQTSHFAPSAAVFVIIRSPELWFTYWLRCQWRHTHTTYGTVRMCDTHNV